MHKTLVIIGASGHGKVVADIALKMDAYDEILFLDDGLHTVSCLGFAVAGKCAAATDFIGKADFFVAIGNAVTREKLMLQLIEKGADIATLIHPAAVIGKGVEIGEGTAVMAGAILNPDSKIGKGCIINTCASVDHDCQVGDYVHLAVGAHLCGTVNVGDNTWIGAGAVVKNNVAICDDCVIGVGAAVIKDICEAGTYVGVPARRIDK